MKTKIYDKRDDFDFNIVNFPFLEAYGWSYDRMALKRYSNMSLN